MRPTLSLRTVTVCSLLALACAVVPGSALAASEADEIARCVRDNGPQDSIVEGFYLTTHSRLGTKRRFGVRLYWKRFDDGSRTLVRVTHPAELRGSSYLVIDRPGADDIYAYLPELERVQRIDGGASRGSVLGTDFTYEDLTHLQTAFMAPGRTRLEDAEFEGRAVYRIATSPSADDSAYSKIIVSVDQDTCLPVAAEFFDDRRELTKRMTMNTKTLIRNGKHWLPQSFSMTDVGSGTRTDVVLDTVSIDEKIRDEVFDEKQLAGR